VGWIPAEHDTGMKDTVSVLNRRADRLAEHGRVDEAVEEWRRPSTWCDVNTTFLVRHDRIQAGMAGLTQRCRMQEVMRSTTTRYQWVAGADMPAELVQAWHKVCPQHPHDHAHMKLAHWTGRDEDMYVTKGPDDCGSCGHQVAAEQMHRAKECVDLTWRWAMVVQAWNDWLQEQDLNCTVEQVGPTGRMMIGNKTVVWLTWAHPRDMHRVADEAAPTWPINHAYHVPARVAQACSAKQMLGKRSTEVLLKMLLIQATVGWGKGAHAAIQTPTPSTRTLTEAAERWGRHGWPGNFRAGKHGNTRDKRADPSSASLTYRHDVDMQPEEHPRSDVYGSVDDQFRGAAQTDRAEKSEH
jgi:hypothetical protein